MANFNSEQYRGKGFAHEGTQYFNQASVYPLQNPVGRGYGVKGNGADPAEKGGNGRMVNQKGETIDFWIHEIEANFSMTGSTAQSRNVRQFMPHNVVQPTIIVKGRAPNQHQYMRMGSFVRASHFNSLNLGESIVEAIGKKQKQKTETVTLVIRNGSAGEVWNGNQSAKAGADGAMGKHVKGIHVPWMVEGYIKQISTGGERFNYAPEFAFEFYVAQSTFKKGTSNLGMWEDTRVYGSELKPWLDWIKKTPKSDFVQVEATKASEGEKNAKEKQANAEKDNLPSFGSVFDTPSIPNLAALAAKEAENE